MNGRKVSFVFLTTYLSKFDLLNSNDLNAISSQLKRSNNLLLLDLNFKLVKRFVSNSIFYPWHVNPYFKFLFGYKTQGRSFFTTAKLGSYNAQVSKILYAGLINLYNTINAGGSVFFISNLNNFYGLQLFKMNYFLNPTFSTFNTFQYSDINYYSNYKDPSIISLPNNHIFDLVVVCNFHPDQFRRDAFKRVGRRVLGLVDFNTRPDIFDYCLPPVLGEAAAIQLLIGTVTTGYLTRYSKLNK